MKTRFVASGGTASQSEPVLRSGEHQKKNYGPKNSRSEDFLLSGVDSRILRPFGDSYPLASGTESGTGTVVPRIKTTGTVVPTSSNTVPSIGASYQAIWNSKQAAAYLQIHERTLIRKAKAREIPGFRIGTCWRFHPEVLRRWAMEQSSKSYDSHQSAKIDKGDK
jgi:excisionase family DNA binding protein